VSVWVLSRKERVRRALNHEPLDRLPTQINYTRAFCEQATRFFGVSAGELPALFGNHIVRLDIDAIPRFSTDGKIKFDWWGVGFDVDEEGYYPAVNPLGESRDLDAYPWPDPEDPNLLEGAKQVLEEYAGVHFMIPNIGFALFERAWALRGLETFMVDMALDPIYAAALLDRIVAIQLVLIHRFIDLGVDGGYFGDDYGAQQNMLFSPKMWRTLIKPRLARLFKPFLEAGLPILMHSDGQIQPIIPDLMEIGLTALNPVQPEVLDHTWLRERFGSHLAYYGGISTQTVLPDGSPDDIKAAVKACRQQLAMEGTGLVIAPSHRLMTDIPRENVEALLDAFAELGG
jgi:uroporphyrinogen decarboxylase